MNKLTALGDRQNSLTMTGLSGHIGNIWKMMNHAECEDGILSACDKSCSLQNLSREVVEEMELERRIEAIAMQETQIIEIFEVI